MAKEYAYNGNAALKDDRPRFQVISSKSNSTTDTNSRTYYEVDDLIGSLSGIRLTKNDQERALVNRILAGCTAFLFIFSGICMYL